MLNKTVKLEPGWELEQHTVNDFSYTKHADPYLNEALALQPDWLRIKDSVTPIARKINYPVLYAFRTAGIVRGPHPYALVVDDMQKDSSAHDYTWYLPLEHDIQITKMQPGNHSLSLILTGDDPNQLAVPSKASPSAPLPPHCDPSAAIPSGRSMLLVRFLYLNNDLKAKLSTEAKEPIILEDAPPVDPSGRYHQRVRRLAVPVHAVNPQFKVLIYPYRQGDPLPETKWMDTHSVTVAWDDQKDQIEFSDSITGKTNLKITRGADALVSVNKAIPPLNGEK